MDALEGCTRLRHLASQKKEIRVPGSKKSHLNNALGGTCGLTSTTRAETRHMEAVSNEQSLGRHQWADEHHWNAQGGEDNQNHANMETEWFRYHQQIQGAEKRPCFTANVGHSGSSGLGQPFEMAANCLIGRHDLFELLGGQLWVTVHILIRVVLQSKGSVRFAQLHQGHRTRQPECVEMLAVLNEVQRAGSSRAFRLLLKRCVGRRVSFLSGLLSAGLISTGAWTRLLFLSGLISTDVWSRLLLSLLTSATMNARPPPRMALKPETTSPATVAGPMLLGRLRMSPKPAIGVGARHVGGLRSTASELHCTACKGQALCSKPSNLRKA